MIHVGITTDKDDIELLDSLFFPFFEGQGEGRGLAGHGKNGWGVFMMGVIGKIMEKGAGSDPG